jgi:Predicted membrane protein (DUF2232)
MPRRLRAIEITEGALLADVAVVFQLIWTYLPAVGLLLRLLIPAVFAVLVFRQRLYVGLLSLCVAVFIAGILTGLNVLDLIYMLLECAFGIFLGVAMRARLSHLMTLALGTLGLGAGLCSILLPIALIWETRTPIPQALRKDIALAATLVERIAALVGLGSWWQHSAYPALAPLIELTVTYWWVVYFVGCCMLAAPVVMVLYLIANQFVRLLGYDVRPFPSGRVARLLRWSTRVLRRRPHRRIFSRESGVTHAPD